MTEEINRTKNDPNNVHSPKADKCTEKKKIKFTDYATERFQGDFIGTDGKIKLVRRRQEKIIRFFHVWKKFSVHRNPMLRQTL